MYLTEHFLLSQNILVLISQGHLDVGVNKPYKTHLRERWESWMFAEGIIHGTTSLPTRKHIAEWAIHANNMLTETVIKNSWRHGEYSWFPEENTNNNNST